MIVFYIYGKKQALLDTIDVDLYECTNCGKSNTTILSVFTVYHHIFWVPLCPVEKDWYALCTECGVKRERMKFGPQLIQEVKKMEKYYRHPWWTWLLTIIVLLPLIIVLISGLTR